MTLLKNKLTKLTWALYNGYGDRKQQGMICFFYDVRDKIFLLIPRDVEHWNFASSFLGVSFIDLKNVASHLIPCTIIIEYDKVVSLITGVSSLEIGAKVRHDKKDLEVAHKAALRFIYQGELQVSDAFQASIQKRYMQKR